MKHTYPRAIALAAAKRIDLGALITHRFPLTAAHEAIRLAAGYADGVVKALVNVSEA
jgi:threonine dehydrogenase-like Zn-dependent dehydrogenase